MIESRLADLWRENVLYLTKSRKTTLLRIIHASTARPSQQLRQALLRKFDLPQRLAKHLFPQSPAPDLQFSMIK